MPRESVDRYLATVRGTFAGPTPTMAEIRHYWETLAAPFGPADDIAFEPVDAGGVPCEWTTAPSARADRIIFYLHGGGYTMGSIPSYRGFLGRISRASEARLLAVGYRLAPEHPFPAAVDDAVAAYRWLIGQGLDPARIALAGDSAGGGLLLSALVALRDAGDPLPAAAVCISPSTDLAKEGESSRTRAALDPLVGYESGLAHARRYVGADGDLKHPLASPLYAGLHGLPPLLVMVGTDEILFDDSTRLVAKVLAADGEAVLRIAEGMIHIWPFFAEILPEGAEAIESIGRYIQGKIP
jgi:acetyl esterase/lipase